MKPARYAAVLAVLTLASACGGSSSGDHPTAADNTPAPAATPPAATTPVAQPSATPARSDKAVAKAILVRASDLPSGWKPTPPDLSPDPEARRLSACLGVPYFGKKDLTVQVHGNFVRADGLASVLSETDGYPNAASAAADVAAYAGPKGVPCQTASAKRVAATHTSGGVTWKLAELRAVTLPGATYGSRAVFHVTRSDGSRIDVTIDLFGFSVDHYEVSFDTAAAGTPLSAALEKHLLAKLRQRATAALAG